MTLTCERFQFESRAGQILLCVANETLPSETEHSETEFESSRHAIHRFNIYANSCIALALCRRNGHR